MFIKKQRASLSRGFSLIELLVAITIISVLTTLGLANYQNSLRRTRDANRQADLELISSALEIYKTDNNEYPTANNICDSSLGSCAACPCTGSDWTGTNVLSDLEPNYILELPVDPINNLARYYVYDPVCNTTATYCGKFYDCTGSGTCCGYRLRTWLESDIVPYDKCS